MDRSDYNTLKDHLKHKDWCNEQDTVITVGLILTNECVIRSASIAFEYIEKPWHWEKEMHELCKDFELGKLMRPILKITDMVEIGDVLNWLEAFGFEQDAVDRLEEDWQENHQEERHD